MHQDIILFQCGNNFPLRPQNISLQINTSHLKPKFSRSFTITGDNDSSMPSILRILSQSSRSKFILAYLAHYICCGSCLRFRRSWLLTMMSGISTLDILLRTFSDMLRKTPRTFLRTWQFQRKFLSVLGVHKGKCLLSLSPNRALMLRHPSSLSTLI